MAAIRENKKERELQWDTDADVGGRMSTVDNRKLVDINQSLTIIVVSQCRSTNVLEVIGQRDHNRAQKVTVCFLHSISTQTVTS